MWKIAIGFVIFAAISLFVIFKGGDKLDMGGEKHGIEAPSPPEVIPAPAAGPVAAPVTPQPAPAR